MSTVASTDRFLIWPPIDRNDYGGWPHYLSHASWFFGHLASEILLPVETGAFKPTGFPDYASASVLADARKITPLPVDSSPTSFSDVSVILVRTKHVRDHPLRFAVKRMQGSESVSGFDEADGPDIPQYYFVGNAESDPQDAYRAVCFTYWRQGGEDRQYLSTSRSHLIDLKHQVRGRRISVFGTGPSIVETAAENHIDDFNVICNTIVKNREFVRTVKPQMVLATDAHLHFSFHRYSARLLSDLIHVVQSHNASFFTFDKFAAFVRQRIPELRDRTFGIPSGRGSYGFDLDRQYALAPGESVLSMFLLPLASFLGDEILLHGFTGRGPDDRLFWAHSDLYQYSDLLPAVRGAHPAFFAGRDYEAYAAEVDRQVAVRVAAARKEGKTVRAATTSFYRGLNQ